MYITNPSSNIQSCPTSQACPICPTCQTCCEPRWFGQFNLLGLIFFLTCLAIFLIRSKKLFFSRIIFRRYDNWFIFFGFLCLFLGILYILSFKYNSGILNCYFKGVLINFSFWPSSFLPIFN